MKSSKADDGRDLIKIAPALAHTKIKLRWPYSINEITIHRKFHIRQKNGTDMRIETSEISPLKFVVKRISC